VFAYPVEAAWPGTISEVIDSGSYSLTTGSAFLYSDTYNDLIAVNQLAVASALPANTLIKDITSSNIKTLTNLIGGSLYVNNTYNNVPLTGGSGFGARANITVSGGAVITVTITDVGAGYQIGDVLSASNTNLGGAGSGFSIDVSAIYLQTIELTNAALATLTETVTFRTRPDLIKVYQHEIGTDEIDGQNVFAVQSYFETSDLGLVTGGPSQPSMEGLNRWLRLERIEPDFIMSGNMNVYVTGRPYAQVEDKTSDPYVFGPSTNKIDMKEQRRELRLKFESNEAGGTYQMGRVLLSATYGDVRGY
jgi:hypothetical protein